MFKFRPDFDPRDEGGVGNVGPESGFKMWPESGFKSGPDFGPRIGKGISGSCVGCGFAIFPAGAP